MLTRQDGERLLNSQQFAEDLIFTMYPQSKIIDIVPYTDIWTGNNKFTKQNNVWFIGYITPLRADAALYVQLNESQMINVFQDAAIPFYLVFDNLGTIINNDLISGDLSDYADSRICFHGFKVTLDRGITAIPQTNNVLPVSPDPKNKLQHISANFQNGINSFLHLVITNPIDDILQIGIDDPNNNFANPIFYLDDQTLVHDYVNNSKTLTWLSGLQNTPSTYVGQYYYLLFQTNDSNILPINVKPFVVTKDGRKHYLNQNTSITNQYRPYTITQSMGKVLLMVNEWCWIKLTGRKTLISSTLFFDICNGVYGPQTYDITSLIISSEGENPYYGNANVNYLAYLRGVYIDGQTSKSSTNNLTDHSAFTFTDYIN